jgi:RHH-type proline utilization regulon transcriptional repressor/proline dehydrogenase/delta 1-pyrroline-5-carboxylate dehydrogenase
MEIKRCQERGRGIFQCSRARPTDVSYLCARALLASTHIRPAFGTHNALTIATLLPWIGSRRDAEFQRLHGMAEELYETVTRECGCSCRVYAPVGPQRELLPYLIRRMLENGAKQPCNSSRPGDSHSRYWLSD